MAVSPELDINTGLSFTFAGATIIAARKILDVTLPSAEVQVFNSSHQASTGGLEFIGADLTDNGTMEFVVQHKQDVDYFSEVGTEGEVVVTLPNAGSTLTFNAVFQNYTPQSAPFNEPMFADVVFKVSGDVAVVAGA